MKIGIDLGTTNSLVSYWTDDGPVVIPNVLGSNLTPSVVSIDGNDEIYIGQIAKERLITHPHLTASCFKRFMGTEKIYNLGKYSFSSEELSSFIIKSLIADAEAFLKCKVSEGIISVPAYFNDIQRKATKRAAELAGLKVERLISEPTAAAIAYGLHHEKPETKFIVFDLGGGTFDVSILEMFEGVMEVKSIAGDNFLGGEDFTNVLILHILESNGIIQKNLDNKTISMIYKKSEICKYELSSKNSYDIKFQIGSNIFKQTITRFDFEKQSSNLLLRLRIPVERALKDAELTPDDLDAVVLIGGATRMPIIRNVVSKMFNKLPFSNINPDEAVAIGAAIQAALTERNEMLDEVILTDVCPYTLGTGIAERLGNGQLEIGYFLPIIERNTTIPVSKVHRLCTVADNQTLINFEIFQGESRKVENNLKLGEINIKVLSEKAGEQQIDARFTYDINGILEVEVTTVKTGMKRSIIIEKSLGQLSLNEVEARLKALESIKIHPRERTENKLLIARGERIYEETLGEKRSYTSAILARFESALATQDEKKIRNAVEALKKELDDIEG